MPPRSSRSFSASRKPAVSKRDFGASVAFSSLPPTLVETRIVLTRRLGRDVREDVDELLERFGIEKSSFDPPQADLAHDAFLRYGKGRHPASLNVGDCVAYAAAKVARAELIYVGGDFAQTDLA